MISRVSRGEAGFAVVVAMMGMLIMSAIGTALVLATSSETMLARNFRDAAAAIYAAEAVAVGALAELSAELDWSAVAGGPARSTFFDGSGSGRRVLADGSAIDLTTIINQRNCGKTSDCGEADMDRVTAERPWGPNNPRWRLYACGRLADLAATAPGSPFYVLLMVADDPSETDGNPRLDGSGLDNPGLGVLMLRGEAFGPGGAHGAVEMTLAKRPAGPGPGYRVVTWRVVR